MICWFEDRLKGQRIRLQGFVERVSVSRASDLTRCFERIGQAQARGHWIALVLEYELGYWLEPALADLDDEPDTNTERMVALVFESAVFEAIPMAADDPQASVTRVMAGIDRASHQAMIEEIRSLIAAGEVYQINATFGLKVDTRGAAISLYQKIAAANPSQHSVFIEDTQRGRHILSFSPELFLERRGNTLMTRPMKGTAPRVKGDPAQDQAMGRQLRGSSKDLAENLMIVDLLRNDLGRLAVTGSVRVDPLFALESYPTVWTLTSTIRAELRQSIDLLEILRALFPCGSVTGAPKIAAMRHIKRLESGPRGVYCGSLGWLAPNGDMSLNVAIRTLVLQQDRHGTYGVGGGIVHDSVAAKEWQECFWKARVLDIACETEPD